MSISRAEIERIMRDELKLPITGYDVEGWAIFDCSGIKQKIAELPVEDRVEVAVLTEEIRRRKARPDPSKLRHRPSRN